MKRYLHRGLLISALLLILVGCSKEKDVAIEPEQIVEEQEEKVPVKVEPVIIVTKEDMDDISDNQEELLMDAAQYSELDKLLRQITELTNKEQ